MTPTGFEQAAKTPGKTDPADLVYPRVYPSGAILDSGAEELLACWARLDDRGRADLLAVARGLAERAGAVVKCATAGS